MGFQVIISQPAIEDLKNIVSYIAQHNDEAALRLGNELINRTRILETFPEIGRALEVVGKLEKALQKPRLFVEAVLGQYRFGTRPNAGNARGHW